MDKILSIRGRLHDTPSAIEGFSSPEPEFHAEVGIPYQFTGPIITKIITSFQSGPGQDYDTLVAYAGEEPVLEVPRYMARVEYKHDRNANPWDL